MASILAGPRPLTEAEIEAEIEAVAMCLSKVPLAEVSARTGLSPARIAAALDQTRVLARASAARTQQAPSAAPRVQVVRRAAPPRPALALAPPGPWRPGYIAGSGELTDRLAAAPAADELPAAPPANPEPEPSASAAAVLEPGTDAWNELAESPALRAWAVADGWHVPAAGRLPGAIILAYNAAHGGTQ